MSFRNEIAPYTGIHGPTFRMIVDMARPERARFIITPGQSGNLLSPRYDDLMQIWRDAESIEFSDDASGGVLQMIPTHRGSFNEKSDIAQLWEACSR